MATSASSSSKADPWKFDLNVRQTVVEDPVGFIRASALAKDKTAVEGTEVTRADEQKLLALKKRRAMDMGTAPGKQMFMTMFMLWMAGGGVHIFSIMIVGMALMTPIRAISSVQTYFQPVEAEGLDLTQPKLIYVALNFVALGVALYKCFTMGLLPLSSADWVTMVEPRHITEVSGGGISLSV